MGLFKPTAPPATWTDRASAVPPDRSTWVVTLGEYSQYTMKTKTVTAEIDAAVAEIESCGWVLDSITPGTYGITSSSVGGGVSTTMLGIFRRACHSR